MQRRKLFIDCGGYDGCSALKFLLAFPEYDAVTFEPNPALWHYYDDLPTTLVRKAAYTRDGFVSFRVDPVDGDGSTLVEGKTIDFHGQVPNEECPVINVPCIDLSAYVARMAQSYDRIVLKLDVEGAEYEILEKMLADHTLSDVDQLFCEFHHDKISISAERHRDVVTRVGRLTSLEPWDANYAIFKLAPKDAPEQLNARRNLVTNIQRSRRKFRNIQW